MFHFSKPRSLSLFHQLKSSLLFSLPTSLYVLLLLFLLSYNAFTLFSLHIPFFNHHPPLLLPLSPPTHPTSKNSSSTSSPLLPAVKKETLPLINNTHFPTPLLPEKNNKKQPSPIIRRASGRSVKRHHKRGLRSLLPQQPHPPLFQTRINSFFSRNSNNNTSSSSSPSSSYCSSKLRFFITWISPLKSFGPRELLSVETLFNSHPQACLVIVSKSMDSVAGTQILSPFVSKGFRVMAIAPDFNYIFKGTRAESWFQSLKEGNVNPGEVSLGQNLSNLLRLALLYKFGGTYIDADVLVLKSFSKLRNTIGAQNFDARTGKWSRLNNAVLVFDKKHPLLFKFIEEFALTFDGNKWGHNGPYLISRVVSRLSERPGYNFTVLPPSAFYPVDWRGVRSLFLGPRDEVHSRWLKKKMGQIRRESFVVHLWNRHSRNLEVVKGSIVDSIISSCCIFCNKN